MKIESVGKKNPFVKKIEELSGQNMFACYQCGKCSAGCPSVNEMEVPPNQIIRLVQLGEDIQASKSNTMWVCSSCLMCFVRCPKKVDVSKIMEALRLVHLRSGKNIDYLEPKSISRSIMEELPQIALVSNFRKLTA
jgi:heterodisulfide reductase subunit C